jgi:putative ABC transport system permease protein
MSLLRRVSNIFSHSRVNAEIDAELRSHLEMRVEDSIAAGMSPEEARREALVRFGNPTVMKERVAGMDVALTLNSFWNDVCYAFRQLRRTPGFTLTSILILAAGFGVSTAIYSTVRTVLLNPLPYKNPERLVQMVSRWPKTGDQNGWSAPLLDAVAWKSTVPAFQDVAMFRFSLVNLTEGQAEALYGLRITSNLLPMLGVNPQLGRWLFADDDRPGHTHVVVLSDDLWRRRFHADSQIVGKIIHFDSEGYQVLGVMPKGFYFPLPSGSNVQLPTNQMQYWVPLGADPAKERHGDPNAGVIARLKEGVSIKEAQVQLEIACRVLQQEYPASNKGLSASLSSLHQHTVGEFDGPLVTLLVATALILLLVCANITSLLLARLESRFNELAVRMALGGSAWQVARIPFFEGVVLCFCGCLLAVPLAVIMLHVLIQLAPVNVPRLADTRIDSQALAFAIALTAVSGGFVGVMNAFQVFRRSPRDILSEGSRNIPGQPRARLRSSLVIGQVALAVILVSAAGLMLRTFFNLLSTDIGYRPNGVMYAITVLPASRYPVREDVELFYKKVLDQLRASPGIESAAAATALPLVGEYNGAKVQTSEMMGRDKSSGISVAVNEVSPGFIETMGVRIISGRSIRETDTADAPKVTIIDQDTAARLWPHQDPLGKLMNTEDPDKPVWRQVVGIIAPTRDHALDMGPRPSIYLPLSQGSSGISFLVVKSFASPIETVRVLKNVVAAVDSNQSVFFAETVTQLIRDSIATRRFLFLVMMFFAAAALTLSTLGIYGLVSFLAASRVREVGIRMALGATRGNIAGLVVFQGIRLASIGALVGLLGSVMLSHLLVGLLFGVRPFDLGTLLFTMVILGMATTLAALIPALRSAKLQPMKALRTE